MITVRATTITVTVTTTEVFEPRPRGPGGNPPGPLARPVSIGTRNGFTLLEVLVALVVFGCLVVGLAQGVRFGLRAWNAGARVEAAQGDLDAVDRTLRALVAAMVPAADPDAASLSGTADSLALVTELPMASGTTTSVSATLAVDAAHRLVLRWRPDPHAERLGPPVPLTNTTLIEGVSALRLSYLPPGEGWTSAWHRHALPALVRIRVAFMPHSQRRWPDIVAAPVLGQP